MIDQTIVGNKKTKKKTNKQTNKTQTHKKQKQHTGFVPVQILICSTFYRKYWGYQGLALIFFMSWDLLKKNKHNKIKGAQWLKCWTAALKYASSNSSHGITFSYGLITMGKVWTPLSPSHDLNSITCVLLLRWFWN